MTQIQLNQTDVQITLQKRGTHQFLGLIMYDSPPTDLEKCISF